MSNDMTKKEVAHYIGELFGVDFEERHLHRFKIEGKYLFIKCQEKYLYGEDDYIGNNPTMVFVLYFGSPYGEVDCEYDPKGFEWNKKSLKKLVDSWD
jgi:hypothetical protein